MDTQVMILFKYTEKIKKCYLFLHLNLALSDVTLNEAGIVIINWYHLPVRYNYKKAIRADF